ncbi:unnamed protein product [Arctogadus glacialis]
MCTTAFLQIYPVSLGFVFTEILRNRIDRNRKGPFTPYEAVTRLDPTITHYHLDVAVGEKGCLETQSLT